MAVYLVGDTVTVGFSTGVAGETITVNTSRKPTGATFLSYPANFTDLGSGDYLVSFTPDLAGAWYARWTGDVSAEEFIGNWDIDPAAVQASVVPSEGGTTRRTIRQAIADRLDDLKVLTASHDSGGYGTFRDDIELTDAQNAYLGSQAMPISGTALNLGQIVRVVGSDAATHTITVTPDLPAMPQEGDEWELVNLNGKGWRFQDYHRFINQVFANSPDMAQVALEETIADFSESTPTVEIPDEFTHITGVFLVDGDDLTPIPRARRPGSYGQGYWVDRSSRTVRIEGGFRSYGAGGSIVLRGLGQQSAMSSDTDTTRVDTRWLVPEVASRMAASASLHDSRRQALADRLKAEAQNWRDLLRPGRTANTWKL